MRVDLHCHTKKTKQGDPLTRNVDAKTFSNVLNTAGVSIVAITNHNYFNKEEYNSFAEEAKQFVIQVWPGVEFDMNVDGEEGHILIISDPNNVEEFDKTINSLIDGERPDDFVIDYKKLLKSLEPLDVILIAHYSFLKENGFSNKAILEIKKIIKAGIPFLLEPSNLKSVGIMEANGLESIIGSDVKDWSNYPYRKIPSLKMPIKDYRTFKMLLRKDRNVVDSFINQKEKKRIKIQPFVDEGDNQTIEIDIYNDVNIVFGGKATGKTKIIEALIKNFESLGKTNCISTYKASNNIEKYNDIIKINVNEELFDLAGFKDCEKEIDFVKNFRFNDVVSTDKFYKGMKSHDAAGKISQFGFFSASYSFIDNNQSYLDSIDDYKTMKALKGKFSKLDLKKYVAEEYTTETLSRIDYICKEILRKAKHLWIENKAKRYVEWTIERMKEIGKIKSGHTALPTNTGICQLYANLNNLRRATNTVSNELSKEHASKKSLIGLLPSNAEIYLYKNIFINPLEKDIDGRKIKFFSPGMNITTLKSIKKCFDELEGKIFCYTSSGLISDLVLKLNPISSLKECFFVSGEVRKRIGNN